MAAVEPNYFGPPVAYQKHLWQKGSRFLTYWGERLIIIGAVAATILATSIPLAAGTKVGLGLAALSVLTCSGTTLIGVTFWLVGEAVFVIGFFIYRHQLPRLQVDYDNT
ncbi:MAG: hypothetical protein KDK65_04430 [Chlamydiia bacterium]|nr:hypothetical protein [Chlamydiia bacterium]